MEYSGALAAPEIPAADTRPATSSKRLIKSSLHASQSAAILAFNNGLPQSNVRERRKPQEGKLQRLPRRPHEVAQHRHVGAIRADASRIHGQPQLLREIQIDTRIIQLRQTKSLSRQHAVNPRRIHRPRRTMTLPRAPRQFIKLLPIAFVPSRHSVVCCYYPLT